MGRVYGFKGWFGLTGSLVFITLLSCGDGTPFGAGENPDPEPVPVPTGLIVQCDAALDGGTLAANGVSVAATLAEDSCLLYRFEALAGEQYSVQVTVAAGGNVDLSISSLGDFLDLVGASSAFGDAAESATFTADASQAYFIALRGRAPSSEITTRVVRNIPPPSNSGCLSVVDGGLLPSDGSVHPDIVFPRSCVLYSFAGTADSVYELTLEIRDGGELDAIVVAQDASLNNEIASLSGVQSSNVLYPITSVSQTYYVLVEGDFSDATNFEISLTQGNAPIGLADRCFEALSQGNASKDWSPVQGTLNPRQCHLYSVQGLEGALYVMSVVRDEPGLAPMLQIASDSDFENLLTTTNEDVEGLSGEAFVADQNQTYYVGLTTTVSEALNYTLRGLESMPAPTALDFRCNRRTPRSALVVDGSPVQDTVMGQECLAYEVSVQNGVRYALSAIPSSGGLGLFVSSDAEYEQPLGSSLNFSGPQGLAFTPTSTGIVTVFVSGNVDDTTFSLEVATLPTSPAGLSAQCADALNRGTVTVGSDALGRFCAHRPMQTLHIPRDGREQLHDHPAGLGRGQSRSHFGGRCCLCRHHRRRG